eukprot:CAMPEP_0170776456 /NCGR_PEP_ID=MMETSP0733-20121128/11185_1 /TAXON_ID=186038 /ORGANISM="Fragilariopsis kerguelensis, Strain L26-C5" /LENGTH=257 /DNA_ID=CAMNT_0011119449 /DNA_START=80 /DNA_END=853 /DNA_ORIENTATION=-
MISASASTSFFIIVALGVLQWEPLSSVSVMAFVTTPPVTRSTSSSSLSRLAALSVTTKTATHSTNIDTSTSTTPTPTTTPATPTPTCLPMAPSKELLHLFNKQVTQEFIASQTYLSASIWFHQNDWEGMASYMLAESDEERVHGLGFVDFANKRSIPIELQSVPAPPSLSQWESPEDVWESILELEKTNTISLLNLAEAANSCHDYAVLAFLNPFHMTQVHEVDKIGGILAKVRDENRTPGLLRSLDLELGGGPTGN